MLNAYPDWRIPAEVIAIVPTADRSKATVKVRIALLERDDRVVPDMGVRVSFLEERDAGRGRRAGGGRRAACRPRRWSQRDGRSVVFVVRDGRAGLRQVDAGETRDGRRRISRGLAAGEQVVLSPPDEAWRDGGKVAVAPLN